MGVNLSKNSHRIFFVAFMPVLSCFLVLSFYQFFPSIPFWLKPLSPLFVYGVLYKVFEKYAWRHKIFQILGVVSVPDMRGRWKGKLRSSYKENGNNTEISSYLEISQTFSKIFVRTLYEKSQSTSIVANFAELNDDSCLLYTYENEPNSLKSGAMQIHRGTVKIRCLPGRKELIGTYFNSIGNHGDIHFLFEQDDLVGKFTKQ